MATSKFVSGIVENVGSTQITITEDKLRNILLKHVPRLRNSRGWVGAFFTMVSLSATIYACTFKDFIGLKADIWKGIFLVLTVMAIIAFIYFCFNAYNNRSNEELIIEEIKKTENSKTLKERYAYGFKIENMRISFFKEIFEKENVDDTE
ncbi:hypothetical protein [Prevotella sp. E13-27]|uniref:hypothetical protein n=1 Tax=Prevotella sp. E13-27 TaxID=2938122 RepID=UPI00200B5237|nr:hypothetical protein [Prevotella sp. E13-27]MCK8623662.1 hypothetical protein [Prevotella sp. E13-27]